MNTFCQNPSNNLPSSIFAHTHTHTYIYIYIYIHTNIHIYIYIYIHIYVYTFCQHPSNNFPSSIFTHTYICIHIYIYIHIHIYIYMYSYMYTFCQHAPNNLPVLFSTVFPAFFPHNPLRTAAAYTYRHHSNRLPSSVFGSFCFLIDLSFPTWHWTTQTHQQKHVLPLRAMCFVGLRSRVQRLHAFAHVHVYIYPCIYMYEYINICISAWRAFWNLAGVEPVHWKLADINPGARVIGTHRKWTLVLSW